MDLRLFMAGAFPAIVVWAGFFTALGVLVGVPAEHLLRDVERLAATGFLLVALGAGSYIAIRRMPAASRDGDSGDVNVIDEVPGRLRVVLALLLDLAIITVIVAGLNRVVLSAFQLIHPNQLNDFIILVGSVVVLYVVITRRIPGQTAGEGLFDVSYRKRRGGGEGSADRDKTSKGATAKTGGRGGVRRRDQARDARDAER
jgi:hypothetical protein